MLTIVFQAFKTPILYAFGASDKTIVYARQYITIYLVGTIFVQFALGLNTYISGQGNAKVAMLSVLLGAVTNIILDPVFIFGFGMGVSGFSDDYFPGAERGLGDPSPDLAKKCDPYPKAVYPV